MFLDNKFFKIPQAPATENVKIHIDVLSELNYC